MYRNRVRAYFDGIRPTDMNVEEIDEAIRKGEEELKKYKTWEDIGDPDEDC